MPAILTHYTFALVHSRKESKYQDALNLGSQGPDPFFFYGYCLKKRDNPLPVREFGTHLHHYDIGKVYPYCFEYASKSEDKELLFAYIEGLLMHYLVDRYCHPFIFVKAGCPISNEEDTYGFSGRHTHYETMLDYLIGKKANTYTRKVYKCLNIDDNELKIISKMWEYVNKMTLKKDNVHELAFYYSVKDYAWIMKLASSPLSGLWLPLTGKFSTPYGLHMPRRFPKRFKGLDFFNASHSPWPDLFSDEKHNESFPDLMHKALDKYHTVVIPLIDKAKNGVNINEEFAKFVDNIDHHGGKVDQMKVHRLPIWKDLKDLAI